MEVHAMRHITAGIRVLKDPKILKYASRFLEFLAAYPVVLDFD